MDAVIIEAPLVEAKRLHELQARRDGPSLIRVGLQLLLYAASLAGLMVLDEPWWALIPLLLVNGLVQYGFFGLLHETAHMTAFSTRGLNPLFGWVAALAQPMSPALMRAFHFEHHRHTHELERDPELAGMAMMVDWPRGPMWLMTLTGIPVLVARFGWALFAALVPPAADGAWSKVLPFVRPEQRRRVAWEARLLVAIHAGLLTTAILWVPSLLWLYAGMALGHMFLSWYITCEHRGLAEGGTILERTRHLKTPAWVRWLVWNMPYHAEHHAWPAVPWHALPQLHGEVREHLVHVERPLWLWLHGGRERSESESA